MKMLINTIVKKLILAVITLHTVFVFAQKEAPKPSLSGSVDTYYRTNLTGPNGDDAIAPPTLFADLDGFALGMANIIANYEGEKVGFTADLVFGPRGTDAVSASPQHSLTGNIINQLYAYWNLSGAVTLTMGNFNTFLGYETISPAANFNYSTSYLFSYGPISHTGIKANFDLGEDWSVMLALMNATDLTEFNGTGDYAAGIQMGYSGQFLNFLYDQNGFEIDYTGGIEVSEGFFLGVNAAHFRQEDTDRSFTGVAFYPQYETSNTFSIGLRSEYFMTKGGYGDSIIGSNANGDGSVLGITLTGSATIGDLLIKPEIRLDNSSMDFFLDNTMVPTPSLASFIVAAIYTLD